MQGCLCEDRARSVLFTSLYPSEIRLQILMEWIRPPTGDGGWGGEAPCLVEDPVQSWCSVKVVLMRETLKPWPVREGASTFFLVLSVSTLWGIVSLAS